MKHWMMMSAMLLAVFGLALAGCGDKEADGGTTTGDGKSAPKVLRFGGIPNKSSDELTKDYVSMGNYLQKDLGVTIEWVKVASYDAAVTALETGKVDMVWLGGHTAVIAEELMGEKIEMVACRDIDYDFKSYYICNEKHFDKLKGAANLGVLAPFSRDMVLAFGSKGSTSGHLMPRHIMTLAGLNPEQSFKNPEPTYTGNHNNTLAAVADGTADIGAMDMTVWNNASDDLKKKAPVFYTTPGYTDYVWMANKSIGADTIEKLRGSMLKLDASNAEHAEVLKTWSAGKFIKADPKKWDDVRAVRKGLLDKDKDFFKKK